MLFVFSLIEIIVLFNLLLLLFGLSSYFRVWVCMPPVLRNSMG